MSRCILRALLQSQSTMSVSQQSTPTIINAVLCYGYVRLKSKCPRSEVLDFMISTFDPLEFPDAKAILWDYASERSDCADVLGPRTRRKGSASRTACQADCEDILNALQTLDTAEALPSFAVSAEDLMDLPSISPTAIPQKRYSTLLNMQEKSHVLQKESLDAVVHLQEKMAEEISQLRRLADETATRPVPSMTPPSEEGRTSASSRRPLTSAPTSRRKPERQLQANHSRRESPQLTPTQRQPEEWTTVHNKRKRQRKQKVIRGTASTGEQSAFCGAPDVGSVFVYQVHKNASEDDVRNWLQSERNVNAVSVRVMSHADSNLKSFKVSVLKDRIKDLLHADFGWPVDVRVRRFIKRT